jgi:hypothetical protein
MTARRRMKMMTKKKHIWNKYPSYQLSLSSQVKVGEI